MKFKKKKFNVIVALLIIIISFVIVTPTLFLSSATADNEEIEKPIENTNYEPEEKESGSEIYKFKTAVGALKMGLANLDAQGGYTSKLTGMGTFTDTALGLVDIKLDIGAFKYTNIEDDTQFLNMNLTSHGLDFLRIKAENTMINVGENQFLSYDSGTMNGVDQTRALYPTRDEFISKYGKIHTDKFLDFDNSNIISYRIENYNKYQKVIMKVQQSELESIVGCFTNSVRVDLDYKCLAPADVVFYISQYGDLISAQCSALTKLKINYGPFSVSIVGTFHMQEQYFPLDNEEIVNAYNAKLMQYPILCLDERGNKVR